MNPNVCFLLTLHYVKFGSIMKCAVKFNRDKMPEGCESYPMEPKHREWIHSMLPTHVQSIGPIVAVENIFEITEI